MVESLAWSNMVGQGGSSLSQPLTGETYLPSSILLSPAMRYVLRQLSLGRRLMLWQCEAEEHIPTLAWLG